MSKIHYQFSSDTTQRLADARCGKVGYNIIRKQPYMASQSQSEPSVQEETFISKSSIENDKSFDLYEFLKETEGLSYEEIRNGMNGCYTYKKR